MTLAEKQDQLTGLVLAGWTKRVGAFLLDYSVMLIPLFIVKAVFGGVYGSIAFWVIYGAYLILQWIYSNGMSVGNRAMHTQIRDATTGGPITKQQAIWRYAYLEAFVVLDFFAVGLAETTVVVVAIAYAIVDVVFPLYDARNQTIHDKLAKTLVVMTDE
jgi:uncharacterized RDD family membrane protein YckC